MMELENGSSHEITHPDNERIGSVYKREGLIIDSLFLCAQKCLTTVYSMR